MLLHTLAGIAWDPQIRGFLAFGVGVVVLIGSVYVLLATNMGVRLGFMLGATAIFGWLTIMGGIWWTYGSIGMLGQINRWEVQEVDYPGLQDAALPEVRALDTSSLPAPDKLAGLTEEQFMGERDQLEAPLNGWRILPEFNPSFGEAKATVDEHFVQHPDKTLGIATAADYLAVYSFERGGKTLLPENPTRIDRLVKMFRTTFIELRHPAHYAVIQVQPVVKQEVLAGQPPPRPVVDSSEPVVSVVMERNLGDRRFPGAMLCLSSAIMFGLLCMQLHRRDQRVAVVGGLLSATTES